MLFHLNPLGLYSAYHTFLFAQRQADHADAGVVPGLGCAALVVARDRSAVGRKAGFDPFALVRRQRVINQVIRPRER
jgi:hypothetical protein